MLVSGCQGESLQVDPASAPQCPRLVSTDQHLNLRCDGLLSNFACNCNLRHYTEVSESTKETEGGGGAGEVDIEGEPSREGGDIALQGLMAEE